MDYLAQLPKIKYGTDTVTNIFTRVLLKQVEILSPQAYYPYTIKEGERPDHIARNIYGDSQDAWLISIANTMLDPQFEWPLDYHAFKQYIEDKYGSVAAAQATTHAYYNSDGLEIDAETYNATPAVERSSKDAYTWEDEQNEARRNIKLIRPAYAKQLKKQLAKIYQ